MVRQQVAALLDAMVEDHERATGPWEIEWIVLPEIFCLTAGALAQTEFVLTGLQVDEKKMRANLDLTKGLIVSEAVMMGLGPISAANMPTTSSTTFAARWSPPAGRCSNSLPRTRKSPSTSTAPRSTSFAIPAIISARLAPWSTACWRCETGSGSTAAGPRREPHSAAAGGFSA